MIHIKIFGFIKKAFLVGLTVLSYVNPLRATSLSYISMNNQECKARTKIINVNSDDPVFYPYGTETSKCSSTCNNVNNPYAKELMNQDTKNDMKRVSVNVD